MRWAPKHIPEILQAAGEHLYLSLLAVLIALAIALVLGIVCARRPRLYAVALAVAGGIFVIPSLALFAFLVPVMGLGMGPALVGLAAYGVVILLRNVVTGLRDVPPEILDAADGMGFGRWRRLVRIELPLALPLIVSGIRIALVSVVGIATIAAFIGAGGLGTIILMGIDQKYPEKILVGGILTTLIATTFDFLLSRAERAMTRWRAG